MREVQLWLRGGLGAQLFQYSFARLLARERNAQLKIRTGLLPASSDIKNGYKRWPEQISSFGHFGELIEDIAAPKQGKTSLKSKGLTITRRLSDLNPRLLAHFGLVGGDYYFDWSGFEKIPPRNKLVLNGLFVDYTAIAKDRELLRSEIFDIKSPDSDLGSSASSLGRKVAIHMRLGDFLTLQPNLLDKYSAFYSTAIRISLNRDPNTEFVVFSDDAEMASKLMKRFVKGELNFEVFQDSHLRPIETLYLMASCSGLIAAKSTFAWWAGFLMKQKDGFVMFESPWVKDPKFTPENKIFPEDWTLLRL